MYLGILTLMDSEITSNISRLQTSLCTTNIQGLFVESSPTNIQGRGKNRLVLVTM